MSASTLLGIVYRFIVVQHIAIGGFIEHPVCPHHATGASTKAHKMTSS